MNCQIRETLIKLKLIASIKISQKISTHYLQIQESCLSTKISRYIYGENRFATVIFVRNTISNALELLKSEQDEKIKKNIIVDLKLCVTSLQNLSETYSDSIRVVSELEEIRQMIERELPT